MTEHGGAAALKQNNLAALRSADAVSEIRGMKLEAPRK